MSHTTAAARPVASDAQKAPAGSAGDGPPNASAAARFVVRLAAATGAVSGVLAPLALGVMCAFIVWDVFARYVLGAPTIWANEIATYLMVVVALVGASFAHRADAHIRVEILIDRFGAPLRRGLETVGAWAGLWFVLVAGWQGVEFVAKSYGYGSRTFSLLLTPLWIPQLAIAAGWLMMIPVVLGEIEALRPARSRLGAWALLLTPILFALILLALGDVRAEIPGLGLDVRLALTAGVVLVAAALHSGAGIAAGLVAMVGLTGLLLWGVVEAGGGPGAMVAAFALAIIGLMLAGVRVFLAIGLAGLIGVHVVTPVALPEVTAERAWEVLNSFTLTALPMFVLMGVLLLRSGVSGDLFGAMVHWIGRLPGGLAHAGIAACTIFSTVSGSSLATAATMGKIACPEMLERGYNRPLTFGSIAAGGTLGILIPPSIALIIYGSTVGVPIPKLFLAGIVPGLVLSAAFMVVVAIWSKLDPVAVPAGPKSSWPERLRSLWAIAPMGLLVFAVLGSLYLGVATPTEAGAVGAFAALVLCAAKGKLSLRSGAQALREATLTTAFLMLIIVGASILTFVFDFLRIPQNLAAAVVAADVSGPLVILAIAAIYIVLGMFVETTAMILMTLPVMFPIVVGLGYDGVWFGVFVVILVEVGLITPPVGLNLFILRGVVPSAQLGEIARGVAPFGVAMLLVLILLYFVPDLALWLPAQLD